MSYDDPQMMYLEGIQALLVNATERLYDSRTSESERRDLSMRVAMLREQLGAPTIDSMSAASAEEEEGS